MNWIKSNPFVSILAAITALICGLLYYVGSKGNAKYEEVKAGYDEAAAAVRKSEGIPLYPEAPNRDAKKKALTDYRESIDTLRQLFDKYRADDIEPISTQLFTEHLKAANGEVTKALSEAGCEFPEDFFMGFEEYRDQLARSEATGLLDYQLNGVKHALLDLAEARPSQLISVYREELPEEKGGKFQPGPNQVTRPFGYELAFKGSEESARRFISALGDTEPYYYVVRCLSIRNERDTPPTIEDAEFKMARAVREEPEEADPFAAFFPDAADDAEAEDEEPAAEPEADEAAPEAPAAAPVDSSRILAQVLGAEEVIVFVRFDLTMFLPTKELPKP